MSVYSAMWEAMHFVIVGSKMELCLEQQRKFVLCVCVLCVCVLCVCYICVCVCVCVCVFVCVCVCGACRTLCQPVRRVLQALNDSIAQRPYGGSSLSLA